MESLHRNKFCFFFKKKETTALLIITDITLYSLPYPQIWNTLGTQFKGSFIWLTILNIQSDIPTLMPNSFKTDHQKSRLEASFSLHDWLLVKYLISFLTFPECNLERNMKLHCVVLDIFLESNIFKQHKRCNCCRVF